MKYQTCGKCPTEIPDFIARRYNGLCPTCNGKDALRPGWRTWVLGLVTAIILELMKG